MANKHDLARILKSYDLLDQKSKKDVQNALYGRETGIEAVDFLYEIADGVKDKDLSKDLQFTINSVVVRD